MIRYDTIEEFNVDSKAVKLTALIDDDGISAWLLAAIRPLDCSVVNESGCTVRAV